MIRILVADDHAVVRQGVVQILADVKDMLVKDEAQNGTETLDMVSKYEYDVVLLDISMPGRSGLEILEEIKTQRPKLADELEVNTGKLPHERLSDREHQVMLMLAGGKSVSDIASELCLSVKTISTYRTRIMEKMGMKKNAELTLYAVHNKLIN